MVKNIRRDLVIRMKNRMLAEDIVEQFIKQIVVNLDRGGAKEFIDSEKLTLGIEDKEVICDKENNTISLDKEVFSYDFSHVKNLCLSLLQDRF